MLIRPATARDAEKIASVHVRSWQSAYQGLIPQSYLDQLNVEQRKTFWEQYLRNTTGNREGCVVAEEDETIIGFANFVPSRDEDSDPKTTAELASIYLLAERWNQGFGRALFQRVDELWRLAEFQEATLWVLNSNKRAINFYERLGWFVDGKEKSESTSGVLLNESRYRYKII